MSTTGSLPSFVPLKHYDRRTPRRRSLPGLQGDCSALHRTAAESRVCSPALCDAPPIGYLILDPAGRIIDIDPVAKKLLGSAVPELLGKELRTLVAVPDRPRFAEQWKHVCHGRPSRSFAVQMRAPRGRRFPANLLLLRALDDPAASRRMRAVIVDLSELETAQRERERARQTLERQVEERTRELRRAETCLSGQLVRAQELEKHLLEITEREWRRFGQDLRDDACQALTGLAMEIAVLSQRLPKDGVKLAPEFRRLAKDLNHIVCQTRRIAEGLHPASIGDGLVPALRELAASLGDKLRCKVSAGRLRALPPRVAMALYRIAQEALRNTVKRASATHVTIRLRESSARLVLCIQEDGIGLPEAGFAGHGGDIIGSRARSIGGHVIVENHPKKRGVSVTCAVPCHWRKLQGRGVIRP